ncbi:MAG: acetate kinase [Gammaproteobacteria bacterium]|nr:acetate kinase [Gammaproteobacteria bacterium]
MTNSLVFVLNCGSSSLKFALVDSKTEQQILSGLADSLGSDSPFIKIKYNGNKETIKLGAGAMHQSAIDTLVAQLKEYGLDDRIVAVGHRVVHGGEKFKTSALINPEIIAEIEQVSQLAPLHNPANIVGINAAILAFPTLPQVAVFDTAYHQTIPAHAYLYALPYELYKKNGIRRYGFHGTSHFYISGQAAKMLNKPVNQTNIICAHLGNGASVTAIANGLSVDTSMGFTPLEGLVMGTRCGDLDPAINNYLIEQLNYDQSQVTELFNKKSGLLGISELSNDCRLIEEAAEQGHAGAQLALDIFCYRLAKYIASYTVPLGELDAVVFTGGIGENSDVIRAKVLSLLKIFGFTVDKQANLDARFGNAGFINGPTGPKAIVIPTDEELVIAQDAISLIATLEQ